MGNETLPVVKRLEQQGDTYFRQSSIILRRRRIAICCFVRVQKDPGLKAEIYAKIGNGGDDVSV